MNQDRQKLISRKFRTETGKAACGSSDFAGAISPAASIVIIIVFFGALPPWFCLFSASCRRNASISWIIFNDSALKEISRDNVRIVPLHLKDFVHRTSSKLAVIINENRLRKLAYKVNDYKPAFGILFEDYIQNFDFFGYGDIDVIYGDLRRFLTPRILEYNVISTHNWCISGHLAIFRNTGSQRNAFRRVPRWRRAFESAESERFDEDGFVRAFKNEYGWARKIAARFGMSCVSLNEEHAHLVEYFTTPLTPGFWHDGRADHPTVWYWYNGRIYNDRDGARDFIYLHFMNYKSARFMSPIYGRQAPWASLKQIMNVADDQIEHGVRLDFDGIHPLDDEDREKLAAIEATGNRPQGTCP